MEPNPDKVIFYASQYMFLLDLPKDKVSVKLIPQRISQLIGNCVDYYPIRIEQWEMT